MSVALFRPRGFATWAEAIAHALRLNHIGNQKLAYAAKRHDSWRYRVRRDERGRWQVLHPRATSVIDCDECGGPLDETDMAPACGAHRLHIECAPYFRCRWCAEEWDEAVAG